MQQNSSFHTISAKTAGSLIGTQHGERGAGTSIVSAQAQAAIAAKLIERKPAETVVNLRDYLARQCGNMVSMRATPNGPEVSIAAVDGMTPNYAAAAEAVQSSLTPPSEAMIDGLLVELDVSTAKRNGSGSDDDVRLSVYNKLLSGYPADVVRYVLEDWWFNQPSGKWWPMPAELKPELERLTAPRRLAVSKLRKLASAPIETPEPSAPLSEAARAEMKSNLAHFTAPSQQATNDPHADLSADDAIAVIKAKYAGRGPSAQLLAKIEKASA